MGGSRANARFASLTPSTVGLVESVTRVPPRSRQLSSARS